MTPSPGQLVNLMSVGMNHCAIYRKDHPRAVESAREFASGLAALLDAKKKPALFLGVVEGRLVYEGRPLVGPSLIARRLVGAAKRLFCGGFLFQRGLTAEEALTFFALCGEPRSGATTLADARALAAGRGISHVAFSPPFGQPGWLGDGTTVGFGFDDVVTEVAEGFQDMIPVYQALLDTVEDGHADAVNDREVDANRSRTTVEGLLQDLGDDPGRLFHLSRYPDFESYTIMHSVRVALLSILVGRHLGFEDALLVEVGTSGLLHDVGKGKIPSEILHKKGRLDEEERRIVATHSALGAQILLGSPDASPMSVAAAFGHHLRHDRRGYPTVGGWVRSSRVTALLQVCDVFEALTAVRPYKPSLTPRRAYEIMLRDPGAFDPSAFAAFVQAVGLYPPGSRVRLTSGEQAIVSRTGRHIARPTVRITHDASGRALPGTDWPEVDLSDTRGEACGVEEILLDDIRVVEADPRDYADRAVTIVLQECGHPVGEGASRETAAAAPLGLHPHS